jgi:ATP-binding cassette subfamily B multidrug efflux pump
MSTATGGVHDPIFEEEALGKAYDAHLVRRLWPYVRPYWRQVAATLVLAGPLFVAELAPAWIIKVGLDSVIVPAHGADAADVARHALHAPAGVPPLIWLAGLLLLAITAKSWLQYWHLTLMARTGQTAMRDLRRDVFDHIQALHMAFFDRYPVGRLVTRATNDTENVAEMFSSGIVAAVTDLLKMVVIAVALFLVNARLALWTFTVVPLLAAIALLFRWRIREAFRKVRVRIARINATLQESITGMKVVQLFRRESRNAHDFETLNASHRDAWLDSIRYDAALFAVVEAAGGISVALILSFGWGVATAGTLFLFIEWMRLFFLPLRDLSAKYSVMQSAMASSERIFQLLDTEPAIRDPEPRAVGLSRGRGEQSEAEPNEVRGAGEVVFENVWFAYQGEDWVLRDISFRVAPGERVAFAGATGAGKTTIIKLLSRLYEVRRGRILLDGVDLRDLPQAALRGRIAMVLQDVFLFSGTVAANIGLERDDIDRSQIEAAARAVQAHRFIERLPQGYETVLRERGSDLSAGQRQLLSFARALVHGADVLVLDEATSSIDPETELLVEQGLHALFRNRTCLVIAHRLSTIQDADRIYVLHRGQIVERGAHRELLAAGGYYHRLHRLQFRRDEARAAAS